MKKLFILFILSSCFNILFAQTDKAKAMYAEATNGKIDVNEYLQSDFSKVDSTSMHDLAVLFYRANDFESAGKCWEIALGKVKKYGKAYEQILSDLSIIYIDSDDTAKLEWLMSVIEDHNQHELTKECNDYKCKLDRAQYYINHGDEVNAKENILASLELCENDVQRAFVEESFAKILFDIEDFEGAAQYYYSAAKRHKYTGDMDKYVINLYWSAQNYLISKKYDVSEKCYLEVAKLLEDDMSDEGRKKYIKVMGGLGDALYCQGKHSEALNVYRQELDECVRFMPNTEKHAYALENVGKVLMQLKMYDAAEVKLQQACDMYEKLKLINKHSNIYTELTVCHRKSGDDVAADNIQEESDKKLKMEYKRLLESDLSQLPITEKYLGSMVYVNSLENIACSYFGLHDYVQSAHYFALYTEKLRDALREKFLLLSETDRKRVWEEQQENIDDYRYNIAALPDSATDKMQLFIPTLYDMELISKGLMLNSVIEFEKLLSEIGDKKMLDIYRLVKENQKLIDALQANVSEKNLEKTIKLKQYNISLNQQLMEGCAAFSDYTKYLSYTWRDVQKCLDKDDVAIEFTSVSLSPLDKDNYILALIINSTGEPSMCAVSTRDVIKILEQKEDLYDNPKYYGIFWGFLQKYLNGKKRVFFSPDNNLSSIAIEYLTDGKQTFFEKYEVYRLSSTKELCRSYSKTAGKNITIFGDIDYNTNEVAETKGVTYGKLLYGKDEVKGIGACMKKEYKVKVYDGDKATEEQFRKLSYDSPKILHISSHSNYSGNERTPEDQAMDKSVIALSGANVWARDIKNDGVITAADIAQMNLQKCDIAVLSACNTGIGSKSTDGVFGLQRGFKNAGVHTLLMSLKPVYDESTAKLMVEFYKGIINGKSKRQSLLDAQKALKAMGYSAGKYWAPFIMLDGIN